MTLIKSISGIRGTIGGKPGEGLSPLDVVKYAAAYAVWCKKAASKNKIKVIKQFNDTKTRDSFVETAAVSLNQAWTKLKNSIKNEKISISCHCCCINFLRVDLVILSKYA